MFTECCEFLTRSGAIRAADANRSRCAAAARSVCSAVSARARSRVPARHRVHDRAVLRPGLHRAAGASTTYIQAILCRSWVSSAVRPGLPEAWASVSWNQPPSERRSSLLPAPGPLLAQPDQAAQDLQMGLGAALGGTGRAERLQQHAHLQEVGAPPARSVRPRTRPRAGG